MNKEVVSFEQLLEDETRQYLLRGTFWLSCTSLVLLWLALLGLPTTPQYQLLIQELLEVVLPFSIFCSGFIAWYWFRLRHTGFNRWVYVYQQAIVLGWLSVMWMFSHGGAVMLTAVETLSDFLTLLMAIALFPSFRLMLFSVLSLLLLSAYFRFQLMPESWVFNLARTGCMALLLLSGREIIYSWFRKAVRRDAEKRKLLKQFRKLALVDGLTGLSNRRHFDDCLLQEIRAASRSAEPFCLILLDIDFFKRLNDSLGHQAGDDCLRQIGKLLGNSSRRPRDSAARYGGEEFAILLPDTPLAGAEEVAIKIAALLEQAAIPHPDSAVASYITVSQGIVKWQDGMDSVALLTAADEALYQAKQSGRNRYCVANISA